jgi:hypothetical protein
VTWSCSCSHFVALESEDARVWSPACDAMFARCVSAVQWDDGTRQRAEAKVRRAEEGICGVIGAYGVGSGGKGAKKGANVATKADGVVYWV